MTSEITPLGREALGDLWHALGQAGDSDPDFSQSSSFAGAACDALGINADLRAALIQPPSTWVIPRFYRRTFCYKCLAENIRPLSLPTVLKKWCVVSSVVCDYHQLPLLDAADAFGPKLSMAMKFFQMHTMHRDRYLLASRFEDGQKAISSLLRVEGMLSRLEEDSVTGDLSQKENKSKEWMFVRVIICLMLFPRFGLINRHLRNDASYNQLSVFHQAFAHGPLIASVAHRSAALLILGWLYEILPSDESSVIEKLLVEVGGAHGLFDAYKMGHSCNGFTAEHGRLVAHRLAQWLPDTAPYRVLRFVEGFVASTQK